MEGCTYIDIYGGGVCVFEERERRWESYKDVVGDSGGPNGVCVIGEREGALSKR